MVSGQYGHPALKNPTILHQTHPVVAALRARSDELELAALILCPEPVDQANKELVSAHAARLCKQLQLDAAIATKEGGGNADADVTLKMDRLEEEGIAAIGILAEMAGRDGTGPPLVVPPTKATAMVSTGNYDERMTPARRQIAPSAAPRSPCSTRPPRTRSSFPSPPSTARRAPSAGAASPAPRRRSRS